MKRRVLITGGAGFIGSHLADELLEHDYDVRALDCLSAQVHGPDARRPTWLDPRVELLVGDVRDAAMVRRALEGVNCVVHLAAAVGVGQSMYQIAEYTAVNNLGTAVLLEELGRVRNVRLVVASSMSVYGEGRYRTPDGQVCEVVERSLEDLKRGQWEPRLDATTELVPEATSEATPPALSSVYALSKYDQERLCILVGRAYGIPTVALRFFNTYGPRQALSNPYTGVLAIFASRLLNGRAPMVFEDGAQRRDFVSVHDVARACRLALESDKALFRPINVGSGQSLSIAQVAVQLAEVLGRPDLLPEITGKYRVGDIRHCFADVRLAKELLGFEARVPLQRGLVELAQWLRAQKPVDRCDAARRELEAHGLTV